jgi:hypothetical protein
MTVQYKDSLGNTGMAEVTLFPGLITRIEGPVRNATKESDARVYPNPVAEALVVSIPAEKGIYRVTITSQNGGVSQLSDLYHGTSRIRMGGHTPGIYIVRVMCYTGAQYVWKISKQ